MYIPPTGNVANLILEVYTTPTGNVANFELNSTMGNFFLMF